MDRIFEVYTSLVEPLKEFLEKQKPLEKAEYDIDGDGTKERLQDLTEDRHIKDFNRTYKFDLRAKACDILRHLLPLSTLTNVGMFGNGRFYQGLLSHMLTTDYPEFQKIAHKTTTALGEIIPTYIRRAKKSEYAAGVSQKMYELTSSWHLAPTVKQVGPSFEMEDRAELVDNLVKKGFSIKEALGQAEDISTIALMLFPFSNESQKQLRDRIFAMSVSERDEIVRLYIGDRKTRRDRPGRALESGYPYNFDLVIDFGVYKDLQRHRMGSQQRQLFTTRLGFHFPVELQNLGAQSQVEEVVGLSEALFEEMVKINPFYAQYAVLHGHFVRWQLGMNDRALMHMLELRSTPQGHPGYRKAAQEMHNLVKSKSLWKAEIMKFVDHGDYYWSRADSEAKQRVREARLGSKE